MRRGAVWLATMFAVLAAAVVLGATPARAADDRVQLWLGDGFTAGDSARSATVTVTRRSDGCVRVRTGLGIQLPGLSADRLTVQAREGGDWADVALTDRGDGLVVTEGTAPDRDRLCERKSATVRYRIAFLDGAPGGTAHIVAAAYAEDGELLGQAAADRRVRGVPATPSPSPSETASPTPSPSSEPTEVAAAPERTGAASAPVGAQQRDGGFSFVMLLGIVMVVAGIGLLVFLLRRWRADRGEPAPAFAGPGYGVPAYGGPGYGGPAYAGPTPPVAQGVDRTMILPAAGAIDDTPTQILPLPDGVDDAPTQILPKLPD
ncbi:hypothetical protein [Micromonospora pattaloongensis]|nr:hypothetical protein [Micromonospora pattaloongensis]